MSAASGWGRMNGMANLGGWPPAAACTSKWKGRVHQARCIRRFRSRLGAWALPDG